MAKLIDSHAHLDVEAFDADREEVLARAKQNGISAIINVGATDGIEGAKRSLQLAKKHQFIFCSVGIHPSDAKELSEEWLKFIEELASDPFVLGIGETGLDLYWEKSLSDKQVMFFEEQIKLAKKIKKPLIIHSRKAEKECIEILKQNGAYEVGGVFHCFEGSYELAKKVFDINFYISFTGILTFKKNKDLRETASKVPLKKILLETDSPYLAPEPFRGKRCESSYLVETAKVLAEVQGVSLEKVAEETTSNAQQLFAINIPLE